MQNVAALKVRQQTDPCPLGNTTYKSGAANHSYLYDANGNLQSGAGRSLTFNPFNMPQTVTLGTQTSTFGYGPRLERLTKTVTNGAASETTLYIEGLYERRTTGAATTQRYYVPAGDRLVAVAVDTGAGPVDYALHTDRLGSLDVITNSLRTAANNLRFDAWGLRTDGTATASLLTPRGYTGHELDSDSGLVNMNARLYDPLLGRFVSADTVLPDPLNLQSVNRYSYALNNPFRYTDPSGHVAIPFADGGVYVTEWNLYIPLGGGAKDIATGQTYDSTLVALQASQPAVLAANSVGPHFDPQATLLMNTLSMTFLTPVKFDQNFSQSAMATPEPGLQNLGDIITEFAIPGLKLAGFGIGVVAKVGDEAVDVVKGGDNFVDLASTSRRQHILDGEVLSNGRYSGGHRAGTGFPNKSEFPRDWSDDKIMDHISDVATDPLSITRAGRGGDVFARGTREGVEIEVLIRRGEVWTGYPVNVSRNP